MTRRTRRKRAKNKLKRAIKDVLIKRLLTQHAVDMNLRPVFFWGHVPTTRKLLTIERWFAYSPKCEVPVNA